MTRKMIYLLALVLALVVMASAAWATNGDTLDVTGRYFNQRPGDVQFCAKVCPTDSWLDIAFEGETPYGLEFTAGTATTGPQGKACIRTHWPQGVYAVEAVEALPGSGLQGAFESEEAAISVFNANNFCGAQGGGALKLRCYDVPPNVKTTLATRTATFAFIFKQSIPQNHGVFYFDHDNPLGDVEFAAQNFTDILFTDHIDGWVDYKSVEAIGNGVLDFGPSSYEPVHYYLYADNYANDNWFYIAFWDFTGNLLYCSAAIGTPIEGDEQHVFDGKNVVDPCLPP